MCTEALQLILLDINQFHFIHSVITNKVLNKHFKSFKDSSKDVKNDSAFT